jgi:hypothetical protein
VRDRDRRRRQKNGSFKKFEDLREEAASVSIGELNSPRWKTSGLAA